MDIKMFLKKKGINITKGRIKIIEILIENKNSVSVEYIFKECVNRGININLSTVYRTLELFKNKDIVSKFDLGYGKYNYILKKNNHKHTVQCKICNKKVEFDCPMQQIQEIIKNKTGFTIINNELDIEMEGICEECRKKNHK